MRGKVASGSGTLPALLLLLISPAILGAPSPIEEPVQTHIQHQVSVTLKLIQVFVTDKQGRPLTDLGKDDFEIYDNGQIRTITEFEKHFFVEADKQGDQRKPVEPAKEELSSAPDIPRLNRKFFFIFDVEKNDLQGLAQSKKTALRFLDTQVRPTDEVGVISYQARRGLIIHKHLSTDHEEGRKAIGKVRGITGTGSGGVPTEPDEGGDALGHLSLSLDPTSDDERAMLRRNFVATLTEFAKALRSVPGHKNIVLFSCGFARSTLAEDAGLRDAYEAMSKEFGASSSPVFTVNALGARANQLAAHYRGDSTLESLSAASGGRYFRDVARADTIVSGLQSATSNYYVLGYYINEQWDGRFHDVKIHVKREGGLVSAQSGYYNPKPFAQFSDFEKKLHLMDLAFSESPPLQNPIELPLVAFPCHEDSCAYLIAMTGLPLEVVREVMRPPVELTSIVIDQDHSVVESKAGSIQVPDLAKKRIVYYTMMPLKPGAYSCILVIRNMITGQAARARGTATVPPMSASGLHLDPLLLLIRTSAEDTAYFRLAKRGPKPQGEAAQTLDELFPFLSNRLMPVIDEIPAGTNHLFGIARLVTSSPAEAQIELTAVAKPASGGDGITISPSILKKERRGRIDILLLDIPLPELDPGDYDLMLMASDVNSGMRVEVGRKVKLAR